ncbi:MAG: radical SAM family heme chaperone HemW [Ginsengibacter sp.]
MAGIYIHIPFCKQACYYCNFHFSTSLALKNEMIGSLLFEIEIRSKSDQRNISIIDPGEEISTIYFGGGTPSLLSYQELEKILSNIHSKYTVSQDAEITLEANPDDINIEKLKEWKLAGINRLSIGIQSFIERDLVWMNRAHNSTQALQCIQQAREAGIPNFSIDLIFGTPGLTNEEWEKNVQTVIDLDVPHIACYALTVEPKTALDKMIHLKKKENVDNDLQAEQYSILMRMMQDAGYEHYEISNFAKPGFRSRHNSSYWEGEKYIGIGPSAHSYDGKSRQWNVANNTLYIKSLRNNEIPLEIESLSDSQKLNEYVMVSLRTMEGMDLQFVEEKFSKEERDRIETVLENKLTKGTIRKNGNKIILTDEGKLLADAISVKLFK